MRKLVTKIVVMGMALALMCAAATAGEPLATATVNVTGTILPYASVSLESQTITIPALPKNSDTGYGELTFTVTCNCQTTITALAIKPSTYKQHDTVTPGLGVPNGPLYSSLTVEAGANNASYILRITGTNGDGALLAEDMTVSVRTSGAPTTPGTAWIMVSTN